MKIGFCKFSFLKLFPPLKWSAVFAGLALGAMVGIVKPVEVNAEVLGGNVTASWMRGNGYHGSDAELMQDTTISLDCDLQLQNVELNGFNLTVQGDSSRRLVIGHISGDSRVSAVKISGGTVSAGGSLEVAKLTVNGGTLTVDSSSTGICCGQSFKLEGGRVVVRSGSREDGILSYGDIVISGGSVIVASEGKGLHARTGKIAISGNTTVDVTAGTDAITSDGNSSITISGVGSLKAVGNNRGISAEAGNIGIDNSKIMATGGDIAIIAAGSIDVKGRNTVIMAKSGGNHAMRSTWKRITLGSPLVVSSPRNGGLSKDKTYIAKTAGGEEPVNTAYIESGLVVKFDGNGQKMTHAPADQVVFKGSRISEPNPAPVAAGKILEGWYKDAKCKNKWNFMWDTVSGDTVLYAKWLGPQITTTTLPAGKVGKGYTAALSVKGTDSSAIWKGMSGSFPVGLGLTEDGIISGIPMKAGKYTFKVAIRDNIGFDIKELTIEIKDK